MRMHSHFISRQLYNETDLISAQFKTKLWSGMTIFIPTIPNISLPLCNHCRPAKTKRLCHKESRDLKTMRPLKS